MRLPQAPNKTGSLTIREVSLLVDVPGSTLRFWEKELGGGLVPERTPGGQRRYAEPQIAMIELVKDLRQQEYSLARIKEILAPNSQDNRLVPDADSIDGLARSVAELVRREIFRFLNLQAGAFNPLGPGVAEHFDQRSLAGHQGAQPKLVGETFDLGPPVKVGPELTAKAP